MSDYGFAWGPVTVERIAAIERHNRGVYRILRVASDYTALEIHISPAGKTLRVFKNGEELS